MATFQKSLGLWKTTALGVGSLIGAGIFVLIGLVYNEVGSAMPISYLLAALSAFMTAYACAGLAKKKTVAGGEYGYVKYYLGTTGGVITGLLLMIASAAICAVYGFAMTGFIRTLTGFELPPLFLGMFFTVVFVVLNDVGAAKSANFELAMSFILVAGMLFLSIIFLKNAEIPSVDFDLGKIAGGAGLVYLAFYGFQTILVATLEMKNPKILAPKAIYLSLGIVTVLYLLLAVAVAGVARGTFENPELALEILAGKFLGGKAEIVIAFLALLAILTSMNGVIFGFARRVYAMAEDHYIPKIFTKIHPRFHTPYMATNLAVVLVFIFLYFGDIESGAKIASFSYIASMLAIHSAAIKQGMSKAINGLAMLINLILLWQLL